MAMNDEFVFAPGLEKIVGKRTPAEYCPEALELLGAAAILEKEIAQSGFFYKSRMAIVPTLSVAESLADWFVHKAERLDRHYQVWQYQQDNPDSEISRFVPVPPVEEYFSDALKTAREVTHAYERQVERPARKNPFRKIFRRSGNR
jgi:hypothetical protein